MIRFIVCFLLSPEHRNTDDDFVVSDHVAHGSCVDVGVVDFQLQSACVCFMVHP